MAEGAKKKTARGSASSKSEGSDDDGMNPINVGKGAPAFQIAGSKTPQVSPVAGGGLRSPIAGGVHQAPPLNGGANILEQPLGQASKTDGQTVVRNPESLSAPVASSIAGLHEKSGNLSQTNYIQNKDVIAAESRTRKRLAILAVMTFITGLITAYFTVPEIENAVNTNAMLVYHKIKSKIPGYEKNVELPPEQKAEENVAPATRDCVRIISVGISTQRTRALTNGERIEIADCYLLSDNLVNVEIFLKPLRTEIEKLSDSMIEKAPLESQYGPALQLLVMAALKRGAYNDIDFLLMNRCRSWRRSPSCAAKIYSNALRFYSNSAYEGTRKIFAVNGKPLDPWSESVLLMGSGLAFSWQRATTRADESFAAAIKATGNSVALKKVVYETWAIDLHQRGERNRVKAIVKRAHRDLASVDNAAKNKLRLIASLNDPKVSQRAIQTFLKRQEVSYRTRGDVGILDLIGPEALRTKQAKDLLAYVEASRRQIQRQNSASSSVLQTYILWEIRSLMGLGRLAEARQRLLMFKGTIGDTVAGHHLRGAINTALAKTPADFVAAASDFQAAYKLQHNWDSHYGETLSLLRAGRLSLVRLNLKKLTSEARSKAEKQWLLYLELEMMLARNEHPQALKKLQALDTNEPQPESFIRNRLMANIYAGMGERSKAEDYETKLMELTRKNSYYSSIDGLTSPIGPFALMPR